MKSTVVPVCLCCVFVDCEPIAKAGKLLTDAAPDQPIRRAVRQ